jgi:phage/plasmid primase, P4 family, C-terminal domain
LKFEKVFRGFYRSKGDKGKVPVLKYKTDEQLKDFNKKIVSYDEANKQFESFVGYLAEGYILIDLDNKDSKGEYDNNKTESKKLIEILEHLGIKTPIIETPHGHHFYFKCNNKNLTSVSGVYSLIGLKVDYKLGSKYGCACMKALGEVRPIINDTGEVAELPTFLLNNKVFNNTLKELEDIKASTGSRNTFISKYKYQLLKNGYDELITYQVLEIINNYIFDEPLPMKEFTTLMRQEHIEASQDTSGTKEDSFLYYNDKGKLKVHTRKMAEKIVKDFNIIEIDRFLYTYNGNCYSMLDMKDIEKYIYKLHKDITVTEFNEVRKKVELEPETYKEDTNYIALNNGLFNLDTLELESKDKSKIITKYMDIDYIDDIDIITGEPSDSPIKNYILELVQNDFELFTVICEFLGQALYRKNNIIQKCLIIKGDKGNGKSKFLQVLTRFFGTENVSSLDLKQFEQRFGLFGLIGKIVNIGDDISGQYIGESSNIKKVITSEMLPIEQKGKDLFNYKPYVTCIFSCNNMPRFDDSTKAIKRRLCILPFENTYSEENGNINPHIVEQMTTKENMSNLFNWSIWGLRRVLKNYVITKSDKITEAVEEFDRENDPIKTFIDETAGDTELDLKGYFNMKDTKAVYTDYQIWCNNNGFKELNNINFGKQLKQHIPKLKSERYRNNFKRPYRYIL